MRKLLTLFTALLFVGSMWGTEYALIATLDLASASENGSQTAYGVNGTTAMAASGVRAFLNAASDVSNLVTSVSDNPTRVYWSKGNGGTGIPDKVLKIGGASKAGSFTFTIGGDDNVAKVEITGYGWSTSTAVAVNSSVTQSPTSAASETTFPFVLSTATKTIEISISSSALCATEIKLYKALAPTEPTISANDINFGTVYMPNGTNYTHQYSLSVTGTQLGNAITATPSTSGNVAVSGTLTATGGTLQVDVTAPHGTFNDSITLTSGTVKKVVYVTGIVYEKYASPISVAAALSAYEAGTLVANDSLQVRGLVKSASSYYTSATIVITDIDDNTKELTLYAIKSLNKANFASVEENVARDVNGNKFIVSDTLTAYGLVSEYGEPAKPQIASGGYLTAINRNKALVNPEIIATPKSITLETSDAADQSVNLEYNDWEAVATSASAELYSDEACTSEITEGAWVTNFAFNGDFTELTFDVSENTVTAARGAYIKVKAVNANEKDSIVIAISQAAAPTLDTYKPTALANIQSTDVVIITMAKNSKIYALSTAAATGANAKATEVTSCLDGDNLEVLSNAGVFWNIADSTSGYVLYPDGETARWLSHSGSNATSRINTAVNKFWTINKNYLYNTGSSRHIGVYISGSDWRCYAPDNGNIHSNISGETLCFYVKDNGGATALEDVETSVKVVKLLRNGVLYIEKDGKVYNILGTLVK